MLTDTDNFVKSHHLPGWYKEVSEFTPETIFIRHKMPFYSVDVVQRTDGELRLIEIGDGQVSDRKNWDAAVFCEALVENA